MMRYWICEKCKFVWDYIFWAVICWIYYKLALFRCLASYTFTESKLILLGIIVLSCMVGVLLERKDGEKEGSVVFNLLMGYGVYTVLTYMQIQRLLIIICLSLAGVCMVINTLLIMCRRIQSRKWIGFILRKRAVHAALQARNILAIALAVIIAFPGGHFLFGSTIMNANVGTEMQNSTSEQSLFSNMETLLQLQDDVWQSLTVQERLNVLQTVANIEQQYLGLANELNVGMANLNDNVSGNYFDSTHEIVIQTDCLLDSTSWEALNILCHEAYHSYQHRIVDAFHQADENSKSLLMYRSASSYAREFEHYEDGKEDFCSYYDQECERDARNYAEDALLKYYWSLHNYLSETEE